MNSTTSSYPTTTAVYTSGPAVVQAPYVLPPNAVFSTSTNLPATSVGNLPPATTVLTNGSQPINPADGFINDPNNKETKLEKKSIAKAEKAYVKAEKYYSKGDTKKGQKWEKRATDFKAAAKEHADARAKDFEAMQKMSAERARLTNPAGPIYVDPEEERKKKEAAEKKKNAASNKTGAKKAGEANKKADDATKKADDATQKADEGKPVEASKKAEEAEKKADQAQAKAEDATTSSTKDSTQNVADNASSKAEDAKIQAAQAGGNSSSTKAVASN